MPVLLELVLVNTYPNLNDFKMWNKKMHTSKLMKYNKYQALDQRTGFSQPGQVEWRQRDPGSGCGEWEGKSAGQPSNRRIRLCKAEGSGAEFQKLRVTLRPPSEMREVASTLEWLWLVLATPEETRRRLILVSLYNSGQVRQMGRESRSHQKGLAGNSLAVWWLGLWTWLQWARVWSLVRN